MKGYCKICNKKLSKNTCTYCREHFIKSITGKNHYAWKGGLPKCHICGKRLSKYSVKRCEKCMNIGRKYSLKTKQKIKKSVLKNPRKSKIKEIIAIKSSTILGWKKWKIIQKQIMKRDKNKCKVCNKKANLVHHIQTRKEYPELCFKKSNLIAVCRNCHVLLHSKITNFGKNLLTK